MKDDSARSQGHPAGVVAGWLHPGNGITQVGVWGDVDRPPRVGLHQQGQLRRYCAASRAT